jgi:MscS family membrane protein
VVALCLFWSSVAAFAQQPGAGEPAAPDKPAPSELDPLGRSTPAGAINGFIDAIAARDYARAGRYLDLSGIAADRRAAVGPVLARSFQRALDRQGTITAAVQLSGDPSGDFADDLDPDLEHVGLLGTGENAEPVLLRRVGAEGARYWVVARETLRTASTVVASSVVPVSERWLPASFTEAELAGVPVSHWLALVGATLVAFVLIWLALGAMLYALARVGWEASASRRALSRIRWPLALLLTILIAGSASPALGVSIVARQSYGWLAAVVVPVILAWLGMRAIGVVSERVLGSFGGSSRAAAMSIVRFAERVVKTVIVVAAVMAALHAFGFNVTAALAAFGIGGVALALGAQKTVENLFASVTIISDRAIRIGDFCKVGATLGTVEDIGMRSTRIRTVARTTVTIPNSNLVNSEIENFQHRDRYLFNPTLHLATTTPPGILATLLDDLRATFDGDDRLFDRTVRVSLLPPASDRLPIEAFGYVVAVNFDAFLAIQEEFTLKLLQIVAEHGAVLTPPAVQVRRVEPAAPANPKEEAAGP